MPSAFVFQQNGGFMMKMKRVLIAMAAAAVLVGSAVSMTACGGEPAEIVSQKEVKLEGTTWKITILSEEGKNKVLDPLHGGTATFTADTMILSLHGATENVPYTYVNGVVDADGITGTVSSTQIRFQRDGDTIIMDLQ